MRTATKYCTVLLVCWLVEREQRRRREEETRREPTKSRDHGINDLLRDDLACASSEPIVHSLGFVVYGDIVVSPTHPFVRPSIHIYKRLTSVCMCVCVCWCVWWWCYTASSMYLRLHLCLFVVIPNTYV